jgi:hypothetical protein
MLPSSMLQGRLLLGLPIRNTHVTSGNRSPVSHLASRRWVPSGGHHEHVCQATSSMMNVAQTLTLFSLPTDSTDDQVSEVVDSAWSLQYMVRGPVCGSAGSIEQVIVPSNLSDDAGDRADMTAFNNCVLFRYSNKAAMEQFMSNMKTKLMLDEMSTDSSKSTQGIASLFFSVDVPNELEAIFRRGDEWEEGFELFLGLEMKGPEGDCAEFMTLVGQLATSSAYGALQSGVGGVEEVVYHSMHTESGSDSDSTRRKVIESLKCDQIYAVRFGGEDTTSLEAFLQCPPMQAILNHDDRSPVHLRWGTVQRIVSPDKNDKVGSSSL